MHQVLAKKWLNKRELARELRARGHDRVSGETLNRWVRDKEDFEPAVVRTLEAITGLRLSGTKKEPPPEWARALAESAAERAVTRLVPKELLENLPGLLERLEAFLQQDDEDAHEESGSQDPDGQALQGHTAE